MWTPRRCATRLATTAVVVLVAAACTDGARVASDTSDAPPASTAPATSTPTTVEPATTEGATTEPPSTIADPDDEAGAVDSGPATPSEGAGPCRVAPVPDVAGLDPFYTQGCSLRGFWVVAGEPVDPEALIAAAALANVFFTADPVLARALVDSGVRLGIIGADQRTTEMPEYRDLNEVFPEVDWDLRARGLGATPERPLVSAGEENVLCSAGDRYLGEDILLHEFAHTLHEQGLAIVYSSFQADLVAAYDQAVAEDIWADTYAATNPAEYWAEGVQSYFDRNEESNPPNGIHGPIATRQALADADPTLFGLIDRYFAGVELPASCHERP